MLVSSSALVFCTVMAAVGAIVNAYIGFGGLFGLLGALGILFYLQVDSAKHEFSWRRIGFLGMFGFLKGTCLGPLILVALRLDAKVLITALLGSVMIFVCFTLASLVSKRRSYIFLGGILSTVASISLLLNLMNAFLWSESLYDTQLFLGLVMFSGYVIFDTQIIIEVSEYV